MRTSQLWGFCLLLAPIGFAQSPQDAKAATRETLARIRVILEIEHDAKGAEAALRKLLARSLQGRERADARFLLAKTLLGLGRADEAERELEAVLRERPELRPEVEAVRNGGSAHDKVRARIQSEIERLMSPEEHVWEAAARELTWLGERARPMLVEELAKRTVLTEFRRVLRVLCRIGGDELVSLFAQYAKSDDPSIRNSLVLSVETLPTRDALHTRQLANATRELFDDRDPKIRGRAYSFYFRVRPDTELLRRVVGDADADIRGDIGARLAAWSLDESAKRGERAESQRLCDWLTERATRDEALRTGIFRQMAKGRAMLLLRTKSSLSWVLRYVEELERAGLRPQNGSVPRLPADLLRKALHRTPAPTERVASWISELAFYHVHSFAPEDYEFVVEFAKRAPYLKWWEKLDTRRSKRDAARFVLEHLPTFVGQVDDARGCLGLIVLSGRLSPSTTQKVVMHLSAGRFERPLWVSGESDKRLLRHQLLWHLAKHGDYASMSPAIFESVDDVDAWNWLASFLRDDVPGGFAAELLLREPKESQMDLSARRNALYARAAIAGAEGIARATAHVYARGVAHTLPIGEGSKSRWQRLRGVAWVLRASEAFSTEQKIAVVRAAISTDNAQVWDDIPRDIDTVRSYEPALISVLLDEMRDTPWSSSKAMLLDQIVHTHPANKRAVAIARALLQDPGSRGLFLENCAGKPPYRDTLLEVLPALLVGDNLGPAQYAIERLSEIGDEKSLGVLAGLMKNSRADVRATVVAWLAMHAKSAHAMQIFDLAQDPDREVRRQVAFAALEFRDPHIAPKLLVMLADEDETVRKKAREALEALRFLDAQRSHWRSWLTRQGQPSAAMALLNKAQDSARSKPGRLAAIDGLGLLGDVEALPFLVDLLEHEDEDFRRHATEAIATLKSLAKAPLRK